MSKFRDPDTGIIVELPNENPTEQEIQAAVDAQLSSQSNPGSRTLFGLPGGIEKKLFPTAAGLPEETPIQMFKKGGLGALDILGAPKRALGMLRGGKMEQPESGILQPEISKLQSTITGTGLPSKIARGAVGVAGEIVQDPLTFASVGLAKIGTKVTGAGKKLATKIASGLTGVSEEALETAGTKTGAKALRAAAGNQQEIGQDILNALDNIEDYLPEKDIINKAVTEMPPIDINKTINVLESAKIKNPVGSAKQANAKIDEMIKDLRISEKIEATEFRQLRKQIDAEIGDAFGKESSRYIEALKKARNQMKNDLITAAEETGNTEYVDAMKSLSEKLGKSEKVIKILGKDAATRERRIESFVSTLFGNNKKMRRKAVEDLGEIFGQDFLEQSKLANLAAEFGEEGIPGLLPRQTTGRSALGTLGAIGAGTAGQPVVAGGLLAASSPKLTTAGLRAAGVAGKAFEITGKGLSKTAPFATPAAAGRGIINSIEEEKKKNPLSRYSGFGVGAGRI